jgi:hypothetical protein
MRTTEMGERVPGNVERRLTIVCSATQERHRRGNPFWPPRPGAQNETRESISRADGGGPG